MKVYILTRKSEVQVLIAETSAGGELTLSPEEKDKMTRAGWEISVGAPTVPNSQSELTSSVMGVL